MMKVLMATVGSFMMGTAALAALLVSEEANAEMRIDPTRLT